MLDLAEEGFTPPATSGMSAIGLSLARGTVPDETTILNFRHLLEQHGLPRGTFDTVKAYRQTASLLLRQRKLCRPPMASSKPGRRIAFGIFREFIWGMSG